MTNDTRPITLREFLLIVSLFLSLDDKIACPSHLLVYTALSVAYMFWNSPAPTSPGPSASTIDLPPDDSDKINDPTFNQYPPEVLGSPSTAETPTVAPHPGPVEVVQPPPRIRGQVPECIAVNGLEFFNLRTLSSYRNIHLVTGFYNVGGNHFSGAVKAIKHLHRGYGKLDILQALVDTHREVSVMRRCAQSDSPFLGEMLYVAHDQEFTYIFMPLYTQTLEAYIEATNVVRNRRIARDISRIAAEILSGLSALHEMGIIHVDLKPSNILLHTRQMHVRIIDFGSAREFNNHSNPNASLAVTDVVCTAAYCAPEMQVQDSCHGRAMDVFAFGCILWELALEHTAHMRFNNSLRPGFDEDIELFDFEYPNDWKRIKKTHKKSGLTGLIHKIIQKDPKKRWTIPRIQRHRFFALNGHADVNALKKRAIEDDRQNGGAMRREFLPAPFRAEASPDCGELFPGWHTGPPPNV